MASLQFLIEGGEYTIIDPASKYTQVQLQGGQTTNLLDTAFDAFSVYDFGTTGAHLTIGADLIDAGDTTNGNGYLNITGVNFVSADVTADHKFDSNAGNTDALIADLLGEHQHDMAYVIQHLNVNGNTADAIRLVWDYIDDHYSYYNTTVNEYGVRLGVEYAKYLDGGGASLVEIAKYAVDGGDPGTAPDRAQMLHDNLLGNLDDASIRDKFMDSANGGSNGGVNGTADNAVGQELLAYASAYADRGIYNGVENDTASGSNSQAYDNVRVFDFEQGWARPDYIESSFGNLDAAAHDGSNNVFFGAGNSAADYVIQDHVGAGVEVGLKVHYRTGDTVLPTSTDANGVVHYQVDDGYQVGGVITLKELLPLRLHGTSTGRR